MSNFTKIYFDSGIKAHLVSNDLVDDIQGALYFQYQARAVETAKESSFMFDHVGACLVDRAIHTFTVSGLEVKVPAGWWTENIQQFATPTIRQVGSKTYYKFYSAWACLILNESDAKLLISKMFSRIEDLRQDAAEDDYRMARALDALRDCPLLEVNVSQPATLN